VQAKVIGTNSEDQRATSLADRTIALPRVVDIGVDLEADRTAVTRSDVGLR
jgi:hypothetical protein